MRRGRTAEIKVIFCWIIFLLSKTAFSQQNCFDTAIRTRSFLGSDTSVAISKNARQISGNSLLLGKYWQSSSTLFNSFIIKKDPWGNVLWTKSVVHTSQDSSLIFSQVLELTDGTIIAFGTIQSKQSPFHLSQSPVLLCLDQNGAIINSWRIDLRESNMINGFFQSFLCQIDAGTIALLINYSADNITSASLILKFNIFSGSPSWADKFYKNYFYYTNGMIATDSELVIVNNFSNHLGPSQDKQGVNLMKLSSATGNLLLSKSYENGFINTLPSATNFASFLRTDDGNYQAVYITSKDNEPNKVVSVRLNNNFNIVSQSAVGNVSDNYLIRNYSITGSGAFAFSFFNAANPNDQGYIIVDSTQHLVQQRKLKPTIGTNFSVAFANNDLTLNNKKLTVFSCVNRNSKIEFETISTNIYNKDTGCIGFNFNEVTLESFSFQPSSWALDQEGVNLPGLNHWNFSSSNLIVQFQEVCINIKQYDTNLPTAVSKCNNDTVVLKASSDFVIYNWQPPAYSAQLSDSIIQVSPPFTQSYSVAAQTYWGCIVNDTVQVIVNTSQPIHLPADTSICSGNTFIIDAGSPFISYLWNDGSTGRYKTANSVGQYVIEATDSNHCISKDSFQLLNIYAKPSPNIHQKQVLCYGQSDKLFPGHFDSYIWQDGSTSQTYSVQAPGTYWVTVKDENGCQNSDSVNITELADPPIKFIGGDTTICIFESITLKPFYSSASYLWSDGSTLPYLKVNSPGNYSLKITDSNGCTGQAAIVVSQKDCPNILVFPSAFTPNGDGKNDSFRPFIRGSFDHYRLIICNRWGQNVFSTNDPTKYWDGILESKEQTGVFVWLCSYQFKGEQAKTQKGTFVLIR